MRKRVLGPTGDVRTLTRGELRESQRGGWLDLVPHSGSETKLFCSKEQLTWGAARFSKLVEKVWERGLGQGTSGSWDEGTVSLRHKLPTLSHMGWRPKVMFVL